MEHETLIGIAVQTLLLLGAGYRLVLRNDWSNQAMSEKMEGMQLELKKLADVITLQAVQTTHIDNLTKQVTMLQRNVEDMRRGNGFVRGRTSLDGEYGD